MTGRWAQPPPAAYAMGGTRPRTEAEWTRPPERGRLVRFDLADVAADITAVFASRRRPGREAALRLLGDAAAKALPGLADLVAETERAWARAGLAGAALVVAWDETLRRRARPGLRAPVVQAATDVHLVLNVLGRAGTGLLLARAPLDLDPARLGRSLATDDPRLVALARAAGAADLPKEPA